MSEQSFTSVFQEGDDQHLHLTEGSENALFHAEYQILFQAKPPNDTHS